MLQNLHSITSISRVIRTNGSEPVVVMANDFEDYVCKYDSNNKLINEYLGYHFLQIWGFELFPAAYVKISKDHIPSAILNNRINIRLFDKPSFGLKYNNNAIDANNIYLGLKNDSYEISKFSDRFDLMKIALFDLWMANDDRNHNNCNILIYDHKFIPIDHSNLFDGGRLGQKLLQLTQEDSILTSDIALTFLNNKKKVLEAFSELKANLPIFVQNCGNALPTLIEQLPNEWCNDKPLLLENINNSVINNQIWINETISSFSELIHNFNR